MHVTRHLSHLFNLLRFDTPWVAREIVATLYFRGYVIWLWMKITVRETSSSVSSHLSLERNRNRQNETQTESQSKGSMTRAYGSLSIRVSKQSVHFHRAYRRKWDRFRSNDLSLQCDCVARAVRAKFHVPGQPTAKPRIFKLLSNSLNLHGLVASPEGLIPLELWISHSGCFETCHSVFRTWRD